MFGKKCEYCDVKIEKGKEVIENVKVPELTGFRERPFCSGEHACRYMEEIKGTKRTKFCPSCPV